VPEVEKMYYFFVEIKKMKNETTALKNEVERRYIPIISLPPF